jgi:hypothetical protein
MVLIGLVASVVSVLAAALAGLSRMVTIWRRNSRRRFLRDRQQYEAKRAVLNHQAVDWYRQRVDVIGSTSQITCPGWIPKEPIPVSEVKVADDQSADTESVFLERLKSPLSYDLPYRDGARGRFSSRHEAVGTLCRPSLWENRICYRLTRVEILSGVARLSVAPVHFFTGFDTSETLAIELLRNTEARRNRRFALRQAIGSPCDLQWNPVHAGVCTLTIVRGADGVDRFFLMDRDRTAVADGIDQRHLIPAGVFQPSTDHPSAWHEDRDVWRSIVREACEEFLPDLDPVDSSSAAVDLETVEPYATVMRQGRSGHVKCYFLGVGIDPVQLQPEILTSCVFTEKAFRGLFGATFDQADVRNREGRVIGAQVIGTTKSGCRLIGFPFSKTEVEKALTNTSMPLVSGAAACLYLAWQAVRILAP